MYQKKDFVSKLLNILNPFLPHYREGGARPHLPITHYPLQVRPTNLTNTHCDFA